MLNFRVVEGSPAHTAGLKPGDIVTHINRTPVHGTMDVYKMLDTQQELVMTVVGHMGKVFTVTVHPEDPRM